MIGIIGRGLVATAISQQCNGVLYSRSDAFDREQYETIIVAAPTGNRLKVAMDPAADRFDCENILEKINSIQYKHLVYVSTVDIYPNKKSINSRPGDKPDISGYGQNRWWLEKQISLMTGSHVVRLPSLCDPSIPKNILYDIKHKVWLDKISLQSILQWYPLCRIWQDMTYVIEQQMDYANLTSPPIVNRQIVEEFCPELLDQLDLNDVSPMWYDVHFAQGRYWISDSEIWTKFHEYFSD